jgi:hypothetical protein
LGLVPGFQFPGYCRNLLVAVILVFLACIVAPAADGAEDDDLLLRLEVAYVYKLTRFIQWPQAPAGRPFVIGVIGDAPLEDAMQVLEREDRRVGGRHIEIRGYATPDGIGPCEILFVGSAADHWLAAIVRRTAGKPVLLIGDIPDSAGRGLAIELFRKPDIFGEAERLRFCIDPKALKGRDLVVSAQLYDVAEVVQ